MKTYKFPDKFLWGTASASFQVEGATNEDGRGESIWDRFCSVPGNVLNGDTGEVACDHYHRYKEDVAIMKSMGLTAYRFSVAWPRIVPGASPSGTANDIKINEAGLDFYSNLVDELNNAGIEPCLTLYHWDLPQAMQDIGGWANPEMPQYFLAYAKAVFERLKGRVKYWMTLNEPYCAAFLGNYEGRQAPGIKDFSTAVRAAYHMYVAHGLVVKYFRENNIPGEIGIAVNLMGRLPYSNKPEDVKAAKYADGYLNRWFADPIFKGSYPQDMIDLYKSKGVVLPEFKPEDLKLMNQPLDFVGLNYYNDFYVQADSSRWPLGFSIKNPPNVPTNERNWPVTEAGFKDMLLRMKNEYGIKRILITENGTAENDIVGIDGKITDTNRIDYLKRHLLKMHEAMEAGVDVMGYLQWSFCDNFEWAFGYGCRFGLVFIDYPTGKRTIKESGHWYSNIAKTNALEVEV